MRKTLGLLVVLVLFLAGCSDDGTLKISDETSSVIWFSINDGAEITLDVGESYSKSWELSTSIFGNEEKDVDVAYTGMHVFYAEEEKTVEAGSTTKLRIFADGGAIGIWNSSAAFYIEEVYITTSDNPDWGINRIAAPIVPGETVFWTVTPGYWDVQIVDDYGDVFELLWNYIALDETTLFEYTGFDKVDKSPGGMKTEIYTGTSREESKIERKK
ncbi:MAG: hypothetical protein HQ534_13105 [Armatimonadetes bacterium]|nr:hypothetical protein [Armatimonadota bacterium]